jgi:hypothetical protein
MEFSNYELVRYPSGQLVLTRIDVTSNGAASSGPRDVVGVFTNESDAQSALARLMQSVAPLRTDGDSILAPA